MDDDDDLSFEFLEVAPAPARRFMRIDIVVIALGLVNGLAAAVHETTEELRDVVAMHANFKINQADFHEEAVREIETLISPEEE